ncbi:ABC-three component system middle component 6 [Tellurirhabdus rosea]|uniref:ABC-three component system middle component 6 n=1 Tax=Tellurirhabdus rosea TaxID=2674997 RepID=UPI00224C8F35|nr:ABC-three component system middle component 6 [Tellurirhabdus rosea]
MLLPTKHIRIAESILGLGGVALHYLKEKPRTIDDLWQALKLGKAKELMGAYHTFDNLILALDFLFITGAISVDNQGRIYNEANKTER